MTHDPLCPQTTGVYLSPGNKFCVCDLIAKVRADQRAKDALVINEYADERHIATKHPNPSEDIVAALRVAAKRVSAKGEQP